MEGKREEKRQMDMQTHRLRSCFCKARTENSLGIDLIDTLFMDSQSCKKINFYCNRLWCFVMVALGDKYKLFSFLSQSYLISYCVILELNKQKYSLSTDNKPRHQSASAMHTMKKFILMRYMPSDKPIS